MVYADFMGFLFPQIEFITKQGAFASAEDIPLHLCHVTSAPPYVKTMEKIVEEHFWFKHTLKLAPSHMRLLFGLQHPPEDATSRDLRNLRELGITFMTLAYLWQNPFGGGYAAPHMPLTGQGKTLLKHMADAGMVLDLSHACHRTAREALKFICTKNIPLRVVASHSGCFSVYGHPRNLPDDVLVQIARQGGIVGIPAMTWMLHAEDNSIEPMMRHIAHASSIMGFEHVAIGSDCIYRAMTVDEELDNFTFLNAKLADDPAKTRFPDRPEILKGPNRLEILDGEIWSRFGELAAKKITGDNLLHFASVM